MKLSTFLKPLSEGADWVGRGFVAFWRVSRFYFFPSEKNLLVSLWYDFVHYKRIMRGATVYDFLDQRVADYQSELADEGLSRHKKQLRRVLVQTLHNPRVRAEIIHFLETPNPEESYLPLWNKMKAAWRLLEEEPTILLSGDGNRSANVADDLSKEELETEPEHVEEDKNSYSPRLNAKTYIIAADIYFELQGQQGEFKKLSRQIPELTKFVQEHFGMSQVPGTFRKLKGYSYMEIIREGSDGKMGQLKPHFRQIIDHPEIFGSAIVTRARKILDDYFV